MLPTPVSLRAVFTRLLNRRHGGLLVFLALFVGVAQLSRVALLFQARHDISWNVAGLLGAAVIGLVFDLAAGLLWAAPLWLLLTFAPARAFVGRLGRGTAHALFAGVLYALLFGAVSEWLFWDEFSARFNFIAVDYLVYTKEVAGNIRESYPLPAIFGGLLVATIVGHALLLRSGLLTRWLAAPAEPWARRWRGSLPWLAAMLVAGITLQERFIPSFSDNYQRELAKNGLWSLFAAFRANELRYDQFYTTAPLDDAFATLRHDLAADGSLLPATNARDTLRDVRNPGPELRPNIIQITVESLSADFLGCFNPASKLTPNLDALAPRSLVFTRFYATGTRTDRGMEALTLSLPPTAGRSLVKRPHNEDLFTLGSVLRTRGYDTAFLYGGYGYFDNMNYFFGHNGYRVVDRAAVPKDDITFANAWGACDEDLLRWTLRDADAAHAAGHPFHQFVMTTSNHRPYTYPAGRIDLPSKTSGRAGAVKYTDHAIGEFLRAAATKPWYSNTVFVIVADHCASSAGRAELPVEKYHIPLLIFAPGGQIAPGRVDTVTSQIDFAPTLLGLLHWSYPSRFFGQDVRRIAPDRGRALIGNYQKLGLFDGGHLAVLKPVRSQTTYACDPATLALTPHEEDPALLARTVAAYETASDLYARRAYTPPTSAETTSLDGALSSDPAAPTAPPTLATHVPAVPLTPAGHS
ncbi:MAG TPA: LTA synthase family protein [Opitutaceae bacterium]|nr:LTA synthase family protein [Opitutaceae bacterium]